MQLKEQHSDRRLAGEGPGQGATRGVGSSAQAGKDRLFWRWPDEHPSGTKASAG